MGKSKHPVTAFVQQWRKTRVNPPKARPDVPKQAWADGHPLPISAGEVGGWVDVEPHFSTLDVADLESVRAAIRDEYGSVIVYFDGQHVDNRRDPEAEYESGGYWEPEPPLIETRVRAQMTERSISAHAYYFRQREWLYNMMLKARRKRVS